MYSPFGGEASTAKKVTFWTLAGSGLVLTTVGMISLAQRASLEGEREDMIRANGGDPSPFAGPAECRNVAECTALRAKNDDVNAADSRFVMGTALGGGLGVAALATLFLWPSEKAESKTVRLTPVVNTQGARLGLEVRF